MQLKWSIGKIYKVHIIFILLKNTKLIYIFIFLAGKYDSENYYTNNINQDTMIQVMVLAYY